jgi:hypothetical protein
MSRVNVRKRTLIDVRRALSKQRWLTDRQNFGRILIAMRDPLLKFIILHDCSNCYLLYSAVSWAKRLPAYFIFPSLLGFCRQADVCLPVCLSVYHAPVLQEVCMIAQTFTYHSVPISPTRRKINDMHIPLSWPCIYRGTGGKRISQYRINWLHRVGTQTRQRPVKLPRRRIYTCERNFIHSRLEAAA